MTEADIYIQAGKDDRKCCFYRRICGMRKVKVKYFDEREEEGRMYIFRTGKVKLKLPRMNREIVGSRERDLDDDICRLGVSSIKHLIILADR